jgi:hypothetical protein
LGHEGLTSFFLNNLSLLIALGVGATAVGIVIAIALAVLEARRSKTGVERGQHDLIQNLSRTVQDLGKTIEDLKRQTIESNQDFAKQIKELQKEIKTARKELDSHKREVEHLLNMERMGQSGTYDTAQPKEEEQKSDGAKANKDSTGDKKTFWHHARDKAEYLIPVWGQWKLIKESLQKKRTGSR